MKKILILIVFATTTMSGCSKNRCVSCIALSEQKEILEHSIICDESARYIEGVRDGIVSRYEQQGNNVEVTCKFN